MQQNATRACVRTTFANPVENDRDKPILETRKMLTDACRYKFGKNNGNKTLNAPDQHEHMLKKNVGTAQLNSANMF